MSAYALISAGIFLLGLAAPVSIAGTNVALGLVTAGTLLHLRSCGGLDWRRAWGPASWALCAYCAAAALTAAAGIAPAAGLRNLPKDLHKLWAFGILLLAFRAAPERRLHSALALGFMFVATFGITQSVGDSWHEYRMSQPAWGWIRAHAFVHPVTYGELLALGLLGGLAFLGQPGQSRTERRLLCWSLPILAAACILNQTRAAVLSLLAGFAILCWARPAYRRWLQWGLGAAVLAAVLLELLPTRRSLVAALCESGWDPAALLSHSQLDRLKLWDVAWRMFQDHPWLGVGPAGFARAFPLYFPGTLAHQNVWSSAHNLFLHQLAERGLVGFAALAGVWTVFLRRAWRRCRERGSAWNDWALAATAAFFIMNLTETAFQNEQVTTIFLLIWTRAEAADHAA